MTRISTGRGKLFNVAIKKLKAERQPAQVPAQTAATKIQSFVRGIQVRKEVATLKKEKEEAKAAIINRIVETLLMNLRLAAAVEEVVEKEAVETLLMNSGLAAAVEELVIEKEAEAEKEAAMTVATNNNQVPRTLSRRKQKQNEKKLWPLMEILAQRPIPPFFNALIRTDREAWELLNRANEIFNFQQIKAPD